MEALIALGILYTIGCFFWVIIYAIDYDTYESYYSSHKRKHAARMLFYTPAWPVLLSIRAYHGVAGLYRTAFIDKDESDHF